MNTNDTERDPEVELVLPTCVEAAGREIELAVGTVAGSMHRRVGRPNQDAVSAVRTPHGLALAVCDGCGSGARSEIGAALGARLWSTAIAERLAVPMPLIPADFDRLAATVLERLIIIADTLGDDLAEVTREHLLFTSVCAAITDDQVAVVAIGDGVVGLGDVVHVLGPFSDNQPPYLTEAWFGVTRTPAVWLRARHEIDSLVLATDGAAALAHRGAGAGAGPTLAQLGGTDVIYRNRYALTRRLTLLADDHVDIDWDTHRTVRRPALLDDDTTIVFARWSAT
jgi:Protein phosphatase 2C